MLWTHTQEFAEIIRTRWKTPPEPTTVI